MKRLLLVPLAATALVVAPVARPHVSVHPNVVPKGQFVQLVVRVPNERPDDQTTKVDVQLPPGFIFVSSAPVPGWTAKIVTRKLAQPVTVFGEQHDEEVGQVTWSGGKIGAGEFTDFPLSVALPDRPAGTRLTFKSLQTYSSGDVVRWIGSPSSESPAPQILLSDTNAPVQDVPAGLTAASQTAATAETASDDDDEDEDDEGWLEENLALILGIVGTLAGLGALGLVLLPREQS